MSFRKVNFKAFSISGPRSWKELYCDIKSIIGIDDFIKQFETKLFIKVF